MRCAEHAEFQCVGERQFLIVEQQLQLFFFERWLRTHGDHALSAGERGRLAADLEREHHGWQFGEIRSAAAYGFLGLVRLRYLRYLA